MRFSFVLAAMLLLATSASVEAQRASFGVWKNPQDSVHVRAQPCGSRMCGVVVWASDKAKADARRGGTNDLVGLILFRDFVVEKLPYSQLSVISKIVKVDILCISRKRTPVF